MRLRRPLVSLGVLAAAVLLVAGCTPSPVQRASFGDGRLGPQGAYVRVPLTVTCRTGWNVAFGDAHVVQANDGRLAQGFGSFENAFPGVPCTGQRQTFSINVFNTSPWVFKPGDAAADGFITVFNEATFELVDTAIDPVEIEIRNSESELAPVQRTTPTRDPRFPRT
jgi:hypothetical protein